MDASTIDGANDADWYYNQPRSPEDLAELQADLADPEPGPPRRSFANDFRRAPSITVAEWHALKTVRTKRRTPNLNVVRVGLRRSAARRAPRQPRTRSSPKGLRTSTSAKSSSPEPPSSVRAEAHPADARGAT